jgi:hypothetical protein
MQPSWWLMVTLAIPLMAYADWVHFGDREMTVIPTTRSEVCGSTEARSIPDSVRGYTIDFQIPAGPGSETLDTFGVQTGLNLSFPYDWSRLLLTPAIMGEMEAATALDRMLPADWSYKAISPRALLIYLACRAPATANGSTSAEAAGTPRRVGLFPPPPPAVRPSTSNKETKPRALTPSMSPHRVAAPAVRFRCTCARVLDHTPRYVAVDRPPSPPEPLAQGPWCWDERDGTLADASEVCPRN